MKPVSVPDEMKGIFYSGDSYLVLYNGPDEHSNLHIWIGKQRVKIILKSTSTIWGCCISIAYCWINPIWLDSYNICFTDLKGWAHTTYSTNIKETIIRFSMFCKPLVPASRPISWTEWCDQATCNTMQPYILARMKTFQKWLLITSKMGFNVGYKNLTQKTLFEVAEAG